MSLPQQHLHGYVYLQLCKLTDLHMCIGLTLLLALFHVGTFGKAPWRPHKDLYPGFGPPSVTHNGITLHENPYAAPDTESDQEENGFIKDSPTEQSNSVYEQPFDSNRTDPVPQRRTST